jgi:hypothetical protein
MAHIPVGMSEKFYYSKTQLLYNSGVTMSTNQSRANRDS